MMRNLICILQYYESSIMEEQAAAISSFYRKSIASEKDAVYHFGINSKGSYNNDYKGLVENYINFSDVNTSYSDMCRKAIDMARAKGFSFVTFSSPEAIIYPEGYTVFLEVLEKGEHKWGYPFGRQSLMVYNTPEIIHGLSQGERPPPSKLFLYNTDSMRQGIFTTFSLSCADNFLIRDRLLGEKSERGLAQELFVRYGKAFRHDGPVTRILNNASPFISDRDALQSDLVYYRLYGDEHFVVEEIFKN